MSSVATCTCPGCGAESGTADYCAGCGAALDPPAEERQPGLDQAQDQHEEGQRQHCATVTSGDGPVDDAPDHQRDEHRSPDARERGDHHGRELRDVGPQIGPHAPQRPGGRAAHAATVRRGWRVVGRICDS